jgi:hypothetical protein
MYTLLTYESEQFRKRKTCKIIRHGRNISSIHEFKHAFPHKLALQLNTAKGHLAKVNQLVYISAGRKFLSMQISVPYNVFPGKHKMKFLLVTSILFEFQEVAGNVLYKPVTFVTHDKINFSSSRQRLLSFSNH